MRSKPTPEPNAGLLAVIRRAVAETLAEAIAVGPAELLDMPAVLSLTSQSRSSLYRAISAGEFPQPLQTPSGKRWRRSDVVKWIAQLHT